MKTYIKFVLLSYLVSIARGIDFSEDIYLFLPLLSKLEPPPACPSNELYKTCASKCSNCNQRGECVLEKCESGCDCAPRFYRVTPDGPCEPVANCPKTECGENEVFRECGPICETCTTIKCRVINCDHKCYCKEGYRRNVERTCIPEDECPKRQRCTRNEEWAESGLVDEFCLHGENDTSSNKTQNVTQCYCKDGYKRNPLGYCISEALCPKMKCIGVEVYHDCIPKCNTTCRNYGNPNCTEDGVCFPGCFCPSGYVMNDFRSCIPVGNCSLDITQVKVLMQSETAEDEETTDTSPPPFENTTDIAESTDRNCTDEITQDHIKDSDEETTMSSEQRVTFSASPMSTSPISETGTREKSLKKIKVTEYADKHESSATSKEAHKQEVPPDEDDFNNEEI